MRKSLQIVFGAVLVLLLSYVAFLDVSTKIKDNLITKTKMMFSENNVRGVTVNMQGEGLEMSRSLVLTGTAISEVERVRIVTLIENIEGVCSVDNQIKLHPVVPKVPDVPSIPKVPTVIKVPVVKISTEPVILKSTAKVSIVNTSAEAVSIKPTSKKSVVESVVEKKEPRIVIPSPTTTTKVPLVPEVINKNIVVPSPVKVIDTPKVIKVEKIKLEGVK